MELTSLNYDKTRCKSPIFSVPLHESFAPHIAHCLLLWGRSEIMLRRILSVMVELTDSEKPHISMQKQISAFLNLTPVCFEGHDELIEHLITMGKDIREKSVARNLLAHGDMVANMPGNTITLTGRHRGKDIQQEFTTQDVEQLFYDISHIAGRLLYLSHPKLIRDDHYWPQIPLRSIQLLQKTFGTTGLNPPTV